MRKTEYHCDVCKIDLSEDTSPGFYSITHDAIPGYGIWGDNRIPRGGIDLCKGCFQKVYNAIKYEK